MRKFVSLLTLFMLLFVFVGTSAIARPDFKDIENHWAKDAIEVMAELGFMEGYPDGTFKPDNTMTRAEFLKILVLAEENGVLLGLEPSFEDTKNHWAHKDGYIETAVEWGIISPEDFPGKKFEPDRPVTRIEMVEWIVWAVGWADKAEELAKEELRFQDEREIPADLTGYVAMAVKKGIIKGYPDDTFRPGRTVSRAEACLVILRRLNAAPNAGCMNHH